MANMALKDLPATPVKKEKKARVGRRELAAFKERKAPKASTEPTDLMEKTVQLD